MISKYAAVAAVGLLCLAGQASAKNASVAQLSAVKGSVMVNQGGSYAKASTAGLNAGSKVVAGADGSAKLTYADGCVVSLAANAMTTIGERSPCAAQTGLVSSAQPMQFDDAGTLIPLIIVGAIVIAGIIEVADGSDDAPTSP